MLSTFHLHDGPEGFFFQLTADLLKVRDRNLSGLAF